MDIRLWDTKAYIEYNDKVKIFETHQGLRQDKIEPLGFGGAASEAPRGARWVGAQGRRDFAPIRPPVP